MEKELQNKMALVGYLIQKNRKQTMKNNEREFDPTHGQGRILTALQEHDGSSLRDLAFALDLAPSSMSEMLTKLEKKGYVTREVDENDKRAQVIKLTDKGKAIQQDDYTDDGEIFSCLEADEQNNLDGYLDHLTESLKIKLCYTDEKMARKITKVTGE